MSPTAPKTGIQSSSPFQKSDVGQRFTDAITVEAWVTSTDDRGEALQALVSKWSPLASFDTFDAFDAAGTDGLNSTGYFGAVFDGRYVYFVPEMDETLATHAVVLRFDTHGDFKDRKSYSAYDACRTAGLDVRGFYGAAFDGTYVYFIPRQIGKLEYHSRLLRFDTRLEFKNPAAWDAFDVGIAQSAQSAIFDGRYLYLCPGFSGDPKTEAQRASVVIRYNTQAPFKDRGSYAVADMRQLLGTEAACFDGGAFDGRYIYFVPLYDRIVVRYDTRGEFQAGSSWQLFDLTPLQAGAFVGAVFDGRHLYFVPYDSSRVIRFDTTADFARVDSWSTFDVDPMDGLGKIGFDGGFFDGRFVYFVPFLAGTKEQGYPVHANFLRHDPQLPFTDRSAWKVHDASQTDGLRSAGYNAGAFDGRFFYCAPWQQGRSPETGRLSVHGKILRYDTLGKNGSFSLRYCDYGHNGGLNAAVPGPSFLVNTERGVLNVAAHRLLKPGRHHLAGVYDGRMISLFIDGVLSAQRSGSGRIQENNEPVVVGQIHNGLGKFIGIIENVRVSATARSHAEIRAGANQWK